MYRPSGFNPDFFQSTNFISLYSVRPLRLHFIAAWHFIIDRLIVCTVALALRHYSNLRRVEVEPPVDRHAPPVALDTLDNSLALLRIADLPSPNLIAISRRDRTHDFSRAALPLPKRENVTNSRVPSSAARLTCWSFCTCYNADSVSILTIRAYILRRRTRPLRAEPRNPLLTDRQFTEFHILFPISYSYTLNIHL